MPTRRRIFVVVAIALGTWIALIVASGLGWNPLGRHWNFANTGAFGDSFGPLSAVMAALAALAAFETLGEQRAELSRIRQREDDEDRRREQEQKERQKRQLIQDLADHRAAFEGAFFKLLDAFRDIAKDTDVGVGEARKTSRDAFQRLCSNLATQFNSSKELDRSWGALIDRYKNDLNHYFRFMYHIIYFVDSQKGIDRYFYIRLVRAMLSEAELILLFANCAVGEGREKFGPLVEKYALLHNVSESSRKGWSMDRYFSERAFNYDRRKKATE